MNKSNTVTEKNRRLSIRAVAKIQQGIPPGSGRLMEEAGVTGHADLRSLRRYTHLHHTDVLKKLGDAAERHNAKDSD